MVQKQIANNHKFNLQTVLFDLKNKEQLYIDDDR